jgi:glycosyltransferase involved in cell wall biosynthesis
MRSRVVTIFLPDLRGGGAERVSLDLAHEFACQGYQVDIVLMSEVGGFLREARENFTVFGLNASKIRNVPIALAKYLRKRRPDALIANMWPLTSAAVVGRLLARWRGRLLLVDHSMLSLEYATWGGIHNLIMRASMIATYRLGDRVAGVSEGAASDIAHLARLIKSEISVLHNPIPQRPMRNANARRDAELLWNCPQGSRVLTVGSLKEAKNHTLLLKAFARLPRTAFRLMIVGEGLNESLLRDLATNFGIVDRVIFAGFQEDPTPFYASADLFVLSSDYEGFGNVIVEAMSFGIPVVSTDCPSGPSEILENGRWGRLVPVGDADALSLAMDEALSTPTDREALKRRASDFAPDIVARKYLDLLGLS